MPSCLIMKSVCGKLSLPSIAASKQLLEIGGGIIQNWSELSWFVVSGDESLTDVL